MAEVCLVQMPYAAIERPSLALGVLKAALDRRGFECKVLYPNIWFAEETGLEIYLGINSFIFNTLLGEWTFASAAFPEFTPDHSEFFDLALVKAELFSGQKKSALLSRASPGDTSIDIFHRIRQAAVPFVDRVARAVLSERPRVVGCTSTFQQHTASLALLRRIRELDPSVVTVLGGANCEGPMGVTTHRCFDWVDFVVSGEADLLFPDLIQAILERGRDVPQKDLPFGTIGPEARRSPELVATPPRVVLQKLDEVPVPDFDDYFEQVERSELKPYLRTGLPVETSRGCWWGAKSHCTFCGLNGDGMSFRSKSPGRVIRELDGLSERYGIKDFEVVDNILDMSYFKSVLPELASREKPYFTFFETKSNLKKEQVALLAKAGIRYVQPGIESLHSGPLELIGKGCTPMTNLQLLKWALEYGILIEWLFLFGFPGEQDSWYGELAEWLPLVHHFNSPGTIATVQFHRFSPYYNRAADYGLSLVPEKTYQYVFPLAAPELANLAYYFDDEEFRERFFAELMQSEKPGMAAFQQAVVRWRVNWFRASWIKNARHPQLAYRVRQDGAWVIRDTRECAIAAEHVIEPLSAAVMAACDGAVKAEAMAVAVSKAMGREIAWHDLEPVVQDLRRRCLLLALDGQYLALAVPEDRPALPSYFPGGYVNLDRYLTDHLLDDAAHNRLPLPYMVAAPASA
ncbi:MAG: RiPP maturation radical SAM C-methyltransferase [Thermoanaerobaculia bacterium]